MIFPAVIERNKLFPILMISITMIFSTSLVIADDLVPDQTAKRLAGVSNSPAWKQIEADPVAPVQARERLFNSPVPSRRSDRSETDPTLLVQELVRGLQYNPFLIHDYIHNHIDYFPMFGSANGADGVILAGYGSSWDQTSLFIALMRASGYVANYVVGDVRYPRTRLANWIGMADNMQRVASVFSNAGVPNQIHPAQGEITITRVWAEVEIGGETYIFDPVMKEYQEMEGINLADASGYDSATFLTNALVGAQTGSDFVQNVNESNIRSDLVDYSMNLVDYINTEMADATVKDIIGGRQIIRQELMEHPTSLPYAVSTSNETVYTELPQEYRHTIQIEHHGIVESLPTYEIAGRRVTIFYRSSDNAPELRVDGYLIAIGDAGSPGARYDLTLTIDHPFAANGGTYADQDAEFSLMCGGMYAICSTVEGLSDDLIHHPGRTLSDDLYAGADPMGEAAMGQTLTLMGQNWFLEEKQFKHFLSRTAEVVGITHHRAGIVGQEAGYFIDMPMGYGSSVAIPGGTEGPKAVFRAGAMMASAFEHGILEQKQGSDNPALSTVKVLQLANQAGHKIFYGTASNWSSIQPQLVNYTVNMLNLLISYLNAGYVLVLPQDGEIVLNQWQGTGFIAYYEQGGGLGMGMIIFGGYAGGWGSIARYGNPYTVDFQQDYLYTQSYNAVTKESNEPVDMATGAYVYMTSDIAFGGAGPMGANFTRHYTSARSSQDGPLGYGWVHNYMTSLDTISDGSSGMGMHLPADASAAMMGAYVMIDLLYESVELDEWVIADLTSKWAMDNLIDNVVSVQVGKNNYIFTQLADGSYSGPPSIGFKLAADGPNYHLFEPFGLRFDLDIEGKITSQTDSNNNQMMYSYDVEDKLTQVTDTFGRSLTINYQDDRISDIVDYSGRSVYYGYSNGNLVSALDAIGETWDYGYDSRSRMVSITKPLINTVITNYYDGLGRVQYQEDASDVIFNTFYYSRFRNVEEDAFGGDLVFYFDGHQQLRMLQDRSGNRNYYQYDGRGQLTRQVDRQGNETYFTYDLNTSKLSSRTDARGNTTTFTMTPRSTRDELYDLTQVDFADGTSLIFSHDTSGNVLSATDRMGKTSTYAYNGRGQMLTETNPEGGTLTLTYNPNGTLASYTDSEIGTLTFGYDSIARRNLVTFPDASQDSYTFDDLNRIISFTDERGNEWTFQYDANRNFIRCIDPKNNFAEATFDDMDRMTRIVDRNGQSITYVYDQMGRLTDVIDPTDVAINYGYNENNWLVSTSNYFQSWLYNSDDEGVLSTHSSPLGHTTNFSVNSMGYLRFFTDPLSHQTEFVRDELNRMTEVIDPLGRSTGFDHNGWDFLDSVSRPVIGTATYEYDDLGNLSLLTDLNGQDWVFDYSNQGRLMQEQDPLGHAWIHTYNDRGWRYLTHYPDADILTRGYDETGNLTSLEWVTGINKTYMYDPDFNYLTSTENLSLEYDEIGRITSTSNINSTEFSAGYDNAGRLSSLTYEVGAFSFDVTYSYDSNTGLLTQVEDDLTGTTIDFMHDTDRRLIQVDRSNGTQTFYTWDNADRLTRIQHGSLADLQYTLDSAGQVSQIDMTAPLMPGDFIMDESRDYTYNSASQISAAGFNTDLRGRVTSDPNNMFEWNGASELASLNGITYEYNGIGNVVTRSDGVDTVGYYYNYAVGPQPVLGERNEDSGEWIRFYVYSPGGALLYMIDPRAGPDVFTYHFDRTGNTLFIADDSADVADAYAYTPYGELLAHTGASGQPFTFSGEYGVMNELNGSTFYRMYARIYDAETARFLSRELMWPQIDTPELLNPYSYALANPVIYLDPTGFNPTLGIPLATHNNNGWYTGFNVQNAGGDTASVTVQYSTTGGLSTASSNSYIPEPAPFPEELERINQTAYTGSAVISSQGSQPIVAVSNMAGPPATSTSGSYSGYSSGCDPVALPLIRHRSSSYKPFFNVQNVGSTATSVTVQYTDGTSQPANLHGGASQNKSTNKGFSNQTTESRVYLPQLSQTYYGCTSGFQVQNVAIGGRVTQFNSRRSGHKHRVKGFVKVRLSRLFGRANVTSDAPIIAVVNQTNDSTQGAGESTLCYQGFNK